MTKIYDLIIIGAGAAGLSGAITAGSEGLSVCLIDEREYGGQCGESSLIENYPGFQHGISGKDLAANMVCQAAKFNVEFKCPFEVMYVERTEQGIIVGDGYEEIEGKLLLIATGVSYRRLEAHGIDRYIGIGVNYGSPLLSSSYKGNVLVVGGANSAGQAALHLSETCNNVKLIVRGTSIENEMSEYLVERVKSSNIEVLCNTNILQVSGDGRVNSVKLVKECKEREIPVDEIFILIGGVPRTQWLKQLVKFDEHGFILTENYQATDRIFVAGDVRSGSLKRVAVAVAEGASAIHSIHEYLSKQLKQKDEKEKESVKTL